MRYLHVSAPVDEEKYPYRRGDWATSADQFGHCICLLNRVSVRVAVPVRVAVRAVPAQQRRGNVVTEKDRTGVSVFVIRIHSVVRTLGTERCELSSLAIAVVGPEDGSQVVAASCELSIERVAFASVPHTMPPRHSVSHNINCHLPAN